VQRIELFTPYNDRQIAATFGPEVELVSAEHAGTSRLLAHIPGGPALAAIDGLQGHPFAFYDPATQAITAHSTA
jgi:hypothetical protein